MLSHDLTQLRSGWDVYGADGAKIGAIAEISINYFVVEMEYLRTIALFVPRSAVVAVGEERVELKFTKDDLEAGNFSSPIGEARPDGDAGTAIDSGYGSRPVVRRP